MFFIVMALPLRLKASRPMTDMQSCQIEKDVVPPLPSAADLPDLRAKVKRRKLPVLQAEMHWSNTLLGAFSTADSPEGLVISWNTVGGPCRTALFDILGLDSSFEIERLELGWMIANMLRIEAVRILNSIPGPNEAMAEASRYYREEERWRCWGLLGSNPPPKTRRRTR
jgi:hypothetical protein